MNIKCDFCKTELKPAYVYSPIGSLRKATVVLCSKCSLIQSVYGPHVVDRTPRCSCDADWGNIRWAKTFRIDNTPDVVIKKISDTSTSSILDVGSNRGSFLTMCSKIRPDLQRLVGIEPDERVIPVSGEGIVYINKRIEDYATSEKYDFIYCCQTLEHVRSASSTLTQLINMLSENGSLYVEVPNTESIKYKANIDEYFIDKHTFHFTWRVLWEFLHKSPVDIEYMSPEDDILNISFVVKKSKLSKDVSVSGLSASGSIDHEIKHNKSLLNSYEITLSNNRSKLGKVAQLITKLCKAMPTSLWGATTILDGLVKYGDFNPHLCKSIVDTYLYKFFPSQHGIIVQNPTILEFDKPDTIVVCARYSANAIGKECERIGIRNIVLFEDLLNSVPNQ